MCHNLRDGGRCPPATAFTPSSLLTQAVKPDIGSESRFLRAPPAFDGPLGGSHRNIAMPFGTEKLEWRGYPTANKF